MAATMPSVEDLTIDEIKAGMADGSMVIVDVREPYEYEAGHIPGALLLPLSNFDPDELPQDGARIVLSCRSGKRSLTAASIAHQAGIPVDAHYAGGFLDWVAAGEDVETGLPED